MQTFERWQPVEVLHAGQWREGRYAEPGHPNWVVDHRVVYACLANGMARVIGVPDCNIRPMPCFLATGDDLTLIEAALRCREHDLIRGEYEGGRCVTDATLKVKDLRDRVRAALEVGR